MISMKNKDVKNTSHMTLLVELSKENLCFHFSLFFFLIIFFLFLFNPSRAVGNKEADSASRWIRRGFWKK